MKRSYNPQKAEPRRMQLWEVQPLYEYDRKHPGPVFSIDTPPATVSGNLHLGHVYSYSHADFIARFQRMRGQSVFYPMGYDDNGLPTERLVEQQTGLRAAEMDRQEFIERCLATGAETAGRYQSLWRRLGLSVDWRYTYRTSSPRAQRIAQWSFIDLFHRELVLRRDAPAIWCPECRTAIAQAEVNDLARSTEFITLKFRGPAGEPLPIATTRSELLPACVAVMVHPEDQRYDGLVGKSVMVPIFQIAVPVLADPAADPDKGTGAVMCCTFGDQTDVHWWYLHQLPLRNVLGPDGRLLEAAGAFQNLPIDTARAQIAHQLEAQDLILNCQELSQSVRVHERCDTPVEYIVTPQWFIRVLDFKAELLEAGARVQWHPEHMGVRYREWVQNLAWDWCISRQRAFGVPFPVWYCDQCGETVLASPRQLPVDPRLEEPLVACSCESADLAPETAVMDTWATSSLTPQIVGGWSSNQAEGDEGLYGRVFPMTLRPQAHEIIRTWAFYTIVQSWFHFGVLPWKNIMISGWGIAGPGMGKISKSRGGGLRSPEEILENYSADAMRYWAASTSTGKDAVIDEAKIQAGAKLATKLWNVARFAAPFLEAADRPTTTPTMSPADRWILSRLQRVVDRATRAMERYDYAAAKQTAGLFFWRELADNYLEMAKLRLYGQLEEHQPGAIYSLSRSMLTVLKLLAPFLPFVTEEIYQLHFAEAEGQLSIHQSAWPTPETVLIDDQAEETGAILIEIARAVRRFKTEAKMPLGSELARLLILVEAADLAPASSSAGADLTSITRAQTIIVRRGSGGADGGIHLRDGLRISIDA